MVPLTVSVAVSITDTVSELALAVYASSRSGFVATALGWSAVRGVAGQWDVAALRLRASVDHRHGPAHPLRHVGLLAEPVEGDPERLQRRAEVDRARDAAGGGVDHGDRVTGRVHRTRQWRGQGAGVGGEVVGHVEPRTRGRPPVGQERPADAAGGAVGPP